MTEEMRNQIKRECMNPFIIMKNGQPFEVIANGKKHIFQYDNTTAQLYLVEKCMKYRVTNPGGVMYGIAEKDKTVVVCLYTDRKPFIMKNPQLKIILE